MQGNITKLVSLVLAGLAFAASGWVEGEARTGLLVVAGLLLGAPIPARAIKAGKSTLVGLVLLSGLTLGGCAASTLPVEGALSIARQECDRLEGVAIHEGSDEAEVRQRLDTIRTGCDFAEQLLKEGARHAGLVD